MDLCQQLDDPPTQAEEEPYNLEKYMEEASEAPQEEKNDWSNLGTPASDVKMSEAPQKVDVTDRTVTLDLDDELVQPTENTTDDTYEVIATINLDENSRPVGCKWGSVQLNVT